MPHLSFRVENGRTLARLVRALGRSDRRDPLSHDAALKRWRRSRYRNAARVTSSHGRATCGITAFVIETRPRANCGHVPCRTANSCQSTWLVSHVGERTPRQTMNIAFSSGLRNVLAGKKGASPLKMSEDWGAGHSMVHFLLDGSLGHCYGPMNLNTRFVTKPSELV